METDTTRLPSREWCPMLWGPPMPGLASGLAPEGSSFTGSVIPDPRLRREQASLKSHLAPTHLLGDVGESFPLSEPQFPYM